MPFDAEPLPEPPRHTDDELLTNLKAAREHIASGWCKHELEDYNGNVCLRGALIRTLTGRVDPCASADYQPIVRPEYALLHEQLPPGYQGPTRNGIISCLVRFNNAQRSVQPVLDLFDRTIAAREQALIRVNA